jgi:hypothetical protein
MKLNVRGQREYGFCSLRANISTNTFLDCGHDICPPHKLPCHHQPSGGFARDDQIPAVEEPDVTAIDLQAESRP